MKNCFPLVSVVAVCYNHEAYVISNLNSIIGQTYKNIQLIIVDDYSNDNSVTIINEWIASNNISATFIKHDKNKGLCYSLNEAISQCVSKYVRLIACDDALTSNSLKRQVEIFEKANNDIALVCGNVMQIDKNGDNIGEYFPRNYTFPYDNLFEAILKGHEGFPVVIHSASVLIKRSVYDDLGLYPEDIIQEDFYMWINLSARFKVIFCNEVFAQYRVLSNSLSNKNEFKLKILLDKLKVVDQIDGGKYLYALTQEKHKLCRKIMKLLLEENKTDEYCTFFDRFIEHNKHLENGPYYIDRVLRVLRKRNLKLARYIYKKYNLKSSDLVLRVLLS